MKKIRLRTKILIAAVLILAIIYVAAVNVMISAALVPEFMRKLDSFDRVTEQSYSEMVKTDEITENTRAARDEAKAFIENSDGFKVKCTSDDGYELIAACFKQQEPEGRPWVVLLHGYTGWKEEMYHYAARYYEQGFNILCPDLRCQGESEGDYIGMGWTDRADVMLWIDMILKSYPDAEIVLHGESMGSSCAIMLTGMEGLPVNVKCVVSDCAYADTMSMFRKQLKDWFSLPDLGFVSSARYFLIMRGGYDLKEASALDQVVNSDTPILFIHGDKDRIVPVSSAEALYEACPSEKDIMIVEGAGHAQCCYKDPEAYYDKVFRFIERYVGSYSAS
ncbi:MAG: alpha/beta fold hydrolase [Firmicutes bacterium]|nr:alpha/beta fold hydrolase [Bacillota bacterium]